MTSKPSRDSRDLHGNEITRLQGHLRRLGFAILDEAGTLGASVRAALAAFQRSQGLPSTGEADPSTVGLVACQAEATGAVAGTGEVAGNAQGTGPVGAPATNVTPTPPDGGVPAGGAKPPRPAVPPPGFIVRGAISNLASGGTSLVAGLVVRAWDKDMRSEQFLGEAVADARGQYQISYSAAQFKRAEKKSADLVVRAFRAGEEAALVASDVIFNARPIETVNLTVQSSTDPGPSEFERYVTTLAPLQENVALASLTEADIAFLHAETDILATHIAFLAVAHQDAATTGIVPEAFYGLFRQNLPTNLAALVTLSAARLHDALDSSVQANIIPSRFGAELTSIVQSLQNAVRRHVVETGQIPLLRVSGVSPDLQEKFLAAYLAEKDSKTPEELWAGLRENPDFKGTSVVDDVQFSLQAGVLTRNNALIVGALQGMRKQGTVKTVRDLTRLTAPDWAALISSSASGKAIEFPPEVVGGTEQGKIQAYSALIVELLKATMPAEYVMQGVAQAPPLNWALLTKLLDQNPGFDPRGAIPNTFNWGDVAEPARAAAATDLDALRQELKVFPGMDQRQLLSSGTNPLRQPVAAFLANAAEFDLGTTHIDRYLATEQAKGLLPAENRDAVVLQLKRIQRIFNVAPRWEHAQALLGAGFHSAFAIASTPVNSFLQTAIPLLGDEASARVIYGAAAHRSRTFSHLGGTLQDTRASAASNYFAAPPLRQVPGLASLFGSMDMCECEHCNSLYGPAAYFVDLLHFLRNNSVSLYETLIARRPDLPFIDLTCDNAETPLPYLDLVNEILEYLVANDLLPVPTKGDSLARNTSSWSVDELSVNPQFVIDAAYEKLKGAVYTTLLPFDRPVEAARSYLKQLGTTRYEVMSTFQNRSGQTPTDLDLALEYLGITTEEYAVLADDYSSKEHLVFGYDSTMGELFHVNEFLLRAGIVYADLVELLKTRYVNPSRPKPPLIIFRGPPPPPVFPGDTVVLVATSDDACDLSKTKIERLQSPQALTPHDWLRMHRFIRVWRNFGWTMQELDKALFSFFGTTYMDAEKQPADARTHEANAMLLGLASLKKLTDQLGLPVIQTLSLWSSIDTFGDDSLYASLFANRTVVPDGDPFRVGSTASLPESQMFEYIPAILAALRIGADDLALLRAQVPMGSDVLPNLSALYRHAILARALKLPIADLLSLGILLGDPGRRRQLQVWPGDSLTPKENDLTPQEVTSFVSRILAAKASGFTVAELNYLYRHLFDQSVAPTKNAIDTVLNGLRDSLRNILAETVLLPDPAGDLLRAKLGLVLDPVLVPAAVALIDNPLVSDAAAFAAKNFSSFLDSKAQSELLAAQPVEARRALVLVPLLVYLRNTLSRGAVKQVLSEALAIEATLTDLLLERLLSSSSEPGQRAIVDFLALVGDGLTASYFANKDLSGAPTLSRLDPSVDFYWGDAFQDASIHTNDFSVSWQGAIRAEHDEEYTFYVRANGGIRLTLTVDDQSTDVFPGAWLPQLTPVEHASQSTFRLKAGQLYLIKLDYFSGSSAAGVALSWSSLSTPKAIVPQSQLYSRPSMTGPDGARTTYLRLHKAGLLARKFRMNAAEADYLSGHSGNFGGFDLNALPLQRSTDQATDDAASHLFGSWESAGTFFALRDRLLLTDETVLTQLFGIPGGDLAKTLAAATGWDEADVSYLRGIHGLDLPDLAFKNADGLTRLADAFALAKQVGADVTQLRGWANAAFTADQGREIVQAVKARYDEATWLSVAKPINDALREKQRDAMVAYLLARPAIVHAGIGDADGLFEYFLIDVSMGAAMVTSRLKEAISSVQLFIQRFFLNLEGGKDDLVDPTLWAWMKNYRVWEANRKVFLYPENWLEPELRDDKSPFFKDLENQLLQNEVTADNVQTALLTYLEKLDEVSRLTICGIHEQKEPSIRGLPEIHTIHVFGRTSHSPSVYYYRRYDSLVAVWSPWEKVSLDMDAGAPLIPAVWNGRLYLFWATFSEKPEKMVSRETLEEWVQAEELINFRAGQQSIYELFSTEWYKLFKNAQFNEHVALKAIAKTLVHSPQPAADTAQQAWIEDKAKFDSYQGRLDIWTRSMAYIDSVWAALGDGNVSIKDYLKTYTPEPVDDPGPLPIAAGVSPVTYWEIKLSWGEYRQNRWSAKKTAQAVLESHPYVSSSGAKVLPALESHRFVCSNRNGDDLYIDCHVQRPSDHIVFGTYAPSIGSFHLSASSAEGTAGKPDSRLGFFIPNNTTMLSMEFDGTSNAGLTLWGSAPTFTSFPILGNSPSRWRVSHSPDDIEPKAGGFASAVYPFGYQDDMRSYVALPIFVDLSALSSMMTGAPPPFALTQSSLVEATDPPAQADLAAILQFQVFHHPQVREFIRRLNRASEDRDGIPALLDRSTQQLSTESTAAPSHAKQTVFYSEYKPSGYVDSDYPLEDVDFRSQGAFSVYNWELFFHIPFLIADRLSKNQQFEDAQKWFHFIFDPTTTDTSLPAPARYWNTVPFANNAKQETVSIVSLLQALDGKASVARSALIKQISTWEKHPFEPHLLARMRVTPYQKMVVMRYLDNLITWGDQLFGRETIESINEATQLYVLAYRILGRRAASIPRRTAPVSMNYNQLFAQGLDDLSNARVELENEFPFSSGTPSSAGYRSLPTNTLGAASDFYFCIPQNDQLIAYWDTVEDRLFKIRHSMNLDGIVRQLPLFEPPIDPALLVRATAMGLDINSVLNDVSAPMPFYRFTVLVQKANELCGELKSLGGMLLSTLEKKDAEELAGLRAGFETVMLQAARDVRQQQIREATVALDAIQRSRSVVEERKGFYDRVIAAGRSAQETAQLDKLKEANDHQSDSAIGEMSARVASNIPDATIGISGIGSVATVTFGGKSIASGFEAFARYVSGLAADSTYQATKSFIEGGYLRRADEWGLQSRLATKELAQIDAQMLGAEVRIAIAQKELENHDKQIENSQAIESFLRDKYTNQELYSWMQSQISVVYFQTYKLACDAAKRAERAFRFERGLTTSNFIQFGYWDNLRQGLLSGERLHLDLKRLEMAYLDQNKREYEITKPISLLALDPMAFLTLKRTGSCKFGLSEALFDADFPGHYMRRIKAVSLTIPCVVGPYTSVNATLSLLSSKTRVDPSAQQSYAEDPQSDDPRFLSQFGAVQSIATSHAQNDAGLFELSFRGDDRYLPFEGSGAISSWQLDMLPDNNAFDFSTISDVILRVSYTARAGGDLLGARAKEALAEAPDGSSASGSVPPRRLFSTRREFPDEWFRFLSSAESDSKQSQTLTFVITSEQFPFAVRGKPLSLSSMKLYLQVKEGTSISGVSLAYQLERTGGKTYKDAFDRLSMPGNPAPPSRFMVATPLGDSASESVGAAPWTLSILESDIAHFPTNLSDTVPLTIADPSSSPTLARLNMKAMEDLWIMVDYHADPPAQ